MATLHDAQYRAALLRRIDALGPTSPGRWGKMSVSQMLWHLNEALEVALGKRTVPSQKTPLPAPIMKFLVLNLPWPRGAPTLPSFVPSETATHEFSRERQRLLTLLAEFAAKHLDDEWPLNPIFGRVTGRDVTRLQAKHVNHHLTQFGV